jgi:alpha-L-rhamnosidase
MAQAISKTMGNPPRMTLINSSALSPGMMRICSFICFVLAMCQLAWGESSEREAGYLRCEYKTEPLSIDAARPQLSWTLTSPTRGARQTAYQILVASSREKLAADQGDLWDSGKVVSDQTVNIEYAGKALVSRQSCHWKVRAWFDNGGVTAWSKPSAWTIGLLDKADWRAKWIAFPTKAANEAQYFRKEVQLDKPVKRAVVRFACLGFSDILINGRKPDESLMIAPRFANPAYRVIYTTLDVTQTLKQGANCIAAILGNGYRSPPSKGWNEWQASQGAPQLLLELEVEFTDGSSSFTGTDDTWAADLGRIRHNDFWTMEVHDLNAEQDGWALPGFHEPGTTWKRAVLVEAPKGRLHALRNPPVRRFESVKALRRDGNKYVFDRVYTGFPRIKVKGKPGDVVSIRGNQQLAMRKVFGPVVIDFTLRDSNEVILEPRFFVHTINGLDQPPAPEDVSIEVVHADLQSCGEFECSNDLFNELHRIGRHTHLNYVLNYPLDPTREKAGWSEDMQNMFDSASYLTDTTTLYEEWWQDYADVQQEDGRVASVAPTNIGHVETWNDPWWGGMIVYTPWRLYEFYGDVRILRTAYEPMKRYFAWLKKKADAKGGILEWAGASDWIEVGIEGWGPPKRTPMFLVSTMAYIYYADILAKTASLLGSDDDAATYKTIAASTRKIFNEKHLDPATGLYAKAADSQAALIMPLALGVVPEESKSLVLRRLEENIKSRNDHLSTGFVSNPYLLHGLTDLGRADLVGRMMNQKDYPSFYTVAKNGVFMETWRGGMAQMPSLGGSSTAWFYRAILGIRCDPDYPGFKHFIIKPEMMPEVSRAKGHFDSIHGRIESNWQREGSMLTMAVTIPANTSATVHVPAKSVEAVTESGKPAGQSTDMKFLRLEKGVATFEVGGGNYQFQSLPSHRLSMTSPEP